MLYYLLSIFLIVIDQLVKWWIRGNIPLGTAIPFIPYLMDLTYTRNTGAAFSSFSGLTWLLALVSLGVGNLIDRVLLGFVTDMFMTTFINFAVFNVADICVVCGGFLMAVYALFFWDKDKEKQA